ncbi:SpoIIIAH-like family protein [Clostridium sp.]|uniref:SpoIIIAH-like family protein n=1 Tax=Clostridium sp. TaxID=1506 RepID=UPI0026054800|nr:SpoIIIAH-like family protein [Clostridium sp.]
MSKKQFGIIFTLMALIAFVGVLASKLNSSGLNDPTDLGQLFTQGAEDERETLGTQDFFYNIRSEKVQKNATTMEQLNKIISDTNTSQEEKALANNELIEKTMLIDQEGRIEINVKNKGFEDVLCSIEDNKVRIVLTANELTEADSSTIQEIAENVAGISDVIIEPKK